MFIRNERRSRRFETRYICLLEIGEQRFGADRSETEFPVICNVVNVVRSRVAGNYNGTPRGIINPLIWTRCVALIGLQAIDPTNSIPRRRETYASPETGRRLPLCRPASTSVFTNSTNERTSNVPISSHQSLFRSSNRRTFLEKIDINRVE